MSDLEILDAPAKIKHYDKIEAGLAELREKYGKVHYDVSSNAGLDEAKKARAAVREPRYELEKIRKALKAPALEYSKRIDSEAKRIEGELLKIELPLDEVIKAEEARREEIKRAKEAAELERQKAIQDRIWMIGHYAVSAAGLSSAKIAAMRETFADEPITLELFGHRTGEAQALYAETSAKLEELYNAALAHEQEQARLAAERAELERQRQEQEAAAKAQREAEAARLAEERAKLAAERKAEEERMAAERAELAAKQAALRAATEAEAAKARQREEEAAAALRAEQEELARQRREFEEQQEAARRAEQERLDAIEREEQERVAAAARAEREREEAARLEAERAEQERLAEAARRDQEQFIQNGPGNAEIVRVLAEHYDVEPDHVLTWLAKFTNPDMADLAA
jgi:DNA repair exonuclease SbcCD ATPase subunit